MASRYRTRCAISADFCAEPLLRANPADSHEATARMQRTHDDKPLSRPLREHLRFRRRLHQTSASRPHGSTVGGPHFWSGASRQTSLATRHLGAASAPGGPSATHPHVANATFAQLHAPPGTICRPSEVPLHQHRRTVRATPCPTLRGREAAARSPTLENIATRSLPQVLHGVRHLPEPAST